MGFGLVLNWFEAACSCSVESVGARLKEWLCCIGRWMAKGLFDPVGWAATGVLDEEDAQGLLEPD